MSGSLLVVLFALAIGWPLAALTGSESSRSGRAGLAILLGFGTIGLAAFFLAAAGIPWSTTSLVAAVSLTGWSAALLAFRFAPRLEERIARPSTTSLVLLAFAAIMVIWHGTFGLSGPRTEADFLEIWGLKGRVFYEHRGIDWRFLTDETTYHNHPDYPPLVPLLFSTAGSLGGRWEDRELGILFTAFGAALLLIAEAALRRRFGSTWLVGAAVAALTPLALTPWIGIAEGPLLAYAAAAMLYIQRGVRAEAWRAAMTGAILLGFAALTKNEGIAMIVAAALALVVSGGGKRWLPWLWPAGVLAAIWIVPREIAGLEGDLASGSPIARVTARLADPLPWLSLVVEHTPWSPLFALGLVLGATVAADRLFRSERLLVAFAAFQVLFYLGAYAVSPHELEWHVRWSWERLVSHVTFVATMAVLAGMIARFREERAPGAQG